MSIERLEEKLDRIEGKVDNLDNQVGNHLPTVISNLAQRVSKIEEKWKWAVSIGVTVMGGMVTIILQNGDIL